MSESELRHRSGKGDGVDLNQSESEADKMPRWLVWILLMIDYLKFKT